MKKLFLIAFTLAALAVPLMAQAPPPVDVWRGNRTSDPATCSPNHGERYYNTSTKKYRFCSASNTWSDLGGGGGVTVGTTTSTGTSNTLLKTDSGGKVNDATGVTHPTTGQLQFQPAKTDYAIVIDRSDNTGDTSGIKLVSGDGSNTAANHAFTIFNSAKDRAVTQTFDSTSSFAFLVDSSSLRFTTSGGVGGREIRLQTPGSGGGAVDRFVTPPGKTLTNNTATSIFDIALPTLTGTGGVIKGSTFVSNGTDVQERSFVWRYTAVNKGGTYTTEIAVVSEAASVSTGTLTGTWTIVTGTNKITLKFTSNSSLTPTTQWVQCTLESFSDQAVTVL